jgi:hypothetical protein
MERSARPRHRRNGSRAGAIVAATWLIGLGLVFLIRDAAGWSWGEAWPLFVILVGVGSGVSEVGWERRRPANPWTLTGPIVLIGIGVVFLLGTTGSLGMGVGDLIARWWPVGLLVLGAWFLVGAFWPSAASQEHLTLPVTGSSASVRIRFGAGDLHVGRSPAGTLVDGTFEGGVVHRLRAGGELQLEPDSARGWSWVDRPLDWRVGLTGEVPLDLRLETGAARGEIDLADLQVRSLRLQTGASQTRVRLPRAAGLTRVSAEAGAAEVVFTVPAGVAASIRSRVALGSTSVDTARFPRTGGGYESPDYATATNRVEIDLQGGVGSFRVEGG